MSEVKVNKISPRSGTGVTLGDSGDTFTVPSGGAITIASGATITNSGTAVNFGATGSASWTSTVKTGDFTAVAGEGYFVNTTSGEIDVALPAGVAGAVVAVKDYAKTWQTNNCILVPNGSDKIGGVAASSTLTTEGLAVTLVFIDSTKGWLVTDSGLQSEAPGPSYSADFLVIAGGGSGGSGTGIGSRMGGGGGAGGFLTSTQTISGGSVYTVTVGDGGAAVSGNKGNNGVNSVVSGSGITTITSIGGGGGGSSPSLDGQDGGSGGGGAGAGPSTSAGGSATSPQGNDGGTGNTGAPGYGGGGGGGAGSVGGNGATSQGGNGGSGTANSITGSSVTRAGGGGGCAYNGVTVGTGGSGGGGAAAWNAVATSGTANTGGGGGGTENANSGAGGSGVVIISIPDADYSGTTTGSPTVATGVSGKTILTFTGSGSYTA